MSQIIEFRLLETDVQSACVPITWCIDKEWLKDNGTDHDILFGTAPFGDGKKAEWRGRGKITDLVKYVTFLRPGKSRIFVIIPDQYYSRFIRDWESRSNGNWKDEIVSYTESAPEIINDFYWRQTGKVGFIDVELPEDVFASEPPAWEKRWVNFFFSSPAKDQCDFRKRRLLAYSVQPVLILLMFIVRWIAFLGLLSCGTRGLNARPLVHPNECIEGIWEEADDPWIMEKTRGTGFAPMGVMIMLAPGVIIGSIILGLLMSLPTWTAILVPFAAIFFVIMVLGIIGSVGTYVERQSRVVSKDPKPIKEIEYLGCPQRIVTLRDLPKEKRSIKLRFTGLKSRICAPYRR